MADATQAPAVRRFGAFEVNLQSGELRKNGMRLRLSGQPFQFLAVLLERPGEVVTREELHSKLWPTDTFVDFDHGLNNAVARIKGHTDPAAATIRTQNQNLILRVLLVSTAKVMTQPLL